MKIEVVMGADAERLIENPEFRAEWKKLYEQCPWGSVYQSEEFVVTWYDVYGSQFTPVIVTGVNGQRELTGLFTLAVATESGQLVVAGSNQSEYQVWLSEPQGGNEFIESALENLSGKFPNKSLALLFVPPATPIEWTKPGNRWSAHCHVRALPRGLMEIGDGSSFKDTLRKKNRNEINRLNRLGALWLDRIRTPEELEAIFDEVICCQALRLRATQNLPDFPLDPLKKAFTMKLMRLPRMIHATVLRVDDKLISAQINTYNREQVLLGLITHWPHYAKCSPGKLHLLMTGMELAKEAVSVLDLTPGGHYKDRFATRHDEVYIITIFLNQLHSVQYKIKRRMAEAAKSTIRAFNVSPEQVKGSFSTCLDWRRKWSMLKPDSLLSETIRAVKRQTWQTDELCVYTFNLDQASNLPDPQVMKRDHIPDLLLYQPEQAWQPPVNKFMKRALENLEAGHHIYTWVEDGKLKRYGWLIGPQEQKSTAANWPDLAIPDDGVLLVDYYMHQQGGSLSQIALCQILRAAANTPGAKQAYICVPAEDHALRQVVEGAGFAYQYSLFRKNRVGRTASWSTAGLAR